MIIEYRFIPVTQFEYNIFPQDKEEIKFWDEMKEEMHINLDEQFGGYKIYQK